MPPNPRIPTNPASPTKLRVTINIRLPMALHRQLRLKALREDMMMKDAVVQAIEAWTISTKQQGPAGPVVEPIRAQAARDTLDALWQAVATRGGTKASVITQEVRDALDRGETLATALANLSISGTIET